MLRTEEACILNIEVIVKEVLTKRGHTLISIETIDVVGETMFVDIKYSNGFSEKLGTIIL